MNHPSTKHTTRLIFTMFLMATVFVSCTKHPAWIRNQGNIFGTSYHLVYESPDGTDLHHQVLLSLDSINKSLSTYDPSSVISRFNSSQTGTRTDAYFNKVYETADKITKATNGAFDMTVAPLVNAWGFGFTHKSKMTPHTIDSLKSLVGMHFVNLQNDSVVRSRPGIMLDASAIAKGFGVDVAAATLARWGCTNYMVEIGGEVIAFGRNPKNHNWRIGIDKPIPDPMALNRQLQLIVQLPDLALATSGNYRQFYIDETGKKLAHTINPVTGRPVKHSLLSATILAQDCMHADAYATACMVLGLKKSTILIKEHPELEACFIYDTEEGMKVTWTKGFEKYITE